VPDLLTGLLNNGSEVLLGDAVVEIRVVRLQLHDDEVEVLQPLLCGECLASFRLSETGVAKHGRCGEQQ
jgi:hypothetical protein